MSCRRTSNAFASFAVADSSRFRIASYYYWRRAESDPRGLAIGIGMTEAMLARAAQADAAGWTDEHRSATRRCRATFGTTRRSDTILGHSLNVRRRGGDGHDRASIGSVARD